MKLGLTPVPSRLARPIVSPDRSSRRRPWRRRAAARARRAPGLRAWRALRSWRKRAAVERTSRTPHPKFFPTPALRRPIALSTQPNRSPVPRQLTGLPTREHHAEKPACRRPAPGQSSIILAGEVLPPDGYTITTVKPLENSSDGAAMSAVTGLPPILPPNSAAPSCSAEVPNGGDRGAFVGGFDADGQYLGNGSQAGEGLPASPWGGRPRTAGRTRRPTPRARRLRALRAYAPVERNASAGSFAPALTLSSDSAACSQSVDRSGPGQVRNGPLRSGTLRAMSGTFPFPVRCRHSPGANEPETAVSAAPREVKLGRPHACRL